MSTMPPPPYLAAPVYLDTETTGLTPREGDRIVEIALIAADGSPLLNTLVNPGRPIPLAASAIHGITDDMVEDAPTLDQLMTALMALVRGRTLVIYNAPFDLAFLPGVDHGCVYVHCAMQMAMNAMHLRRWPRLTAAAEWAGHVWQGSAHRALADAQAARSVYLKCLQESAHAH